MRNNRGTIGDGWNHPHRNNGTNQRKTSNIEFGIHNKTLATQARIANQHQLNQKMSAKICAALLLLPTQANRGSLSIALTPNANTILSTVASFLYAVDRRCNKKKLDLEAVTHLLRFLRYPINISKSWFQPVGAPHTWHHCLQMLQFYATVIPYILEVKQRRRDKKREPTFRRILLKSCLKKNKKARKIFLRRAMQKLFLQVDDIQYGLESSELKLENMKRSQKSLASMEASEAAMALRLERQRQNVIRIDQQNTDLINQIQQAEDEIGDLTLERTILQKQVKMVQQEIKDQKLTVQDARRLEREIRQLRIKKKLLQAEIEKHRKKDQQKKDRCMNKYWDIIEALSLIEASTKQMAGYLKKKKMQFPFPQHDALAFTDALHTENMATFRQAFNKMIEVENVKRMVMVQHSIREMATRDLKLLRNRMKEVRAKKLRMQNKKYQLKTEIMKLNHCVLETQREIHELQMKHSRLYHSNIQTRLKIGYKKLNIERMKKKEVQLKKQIKQRKESMMAGIKRLKKYSDACQVALKKVEQAQQKASVQVREVVARVGKGYNFMNNSSDKFL